MMRRRTFCIAVAMTCVFNAVVWGAGHKTCTATYLGGTVGLFSGTPGTLSTAAQDLLLFTPMSRPLTLRISYKAITAMEYGPGAGQRVPIAIVVSRKHGQYLTVNWMDDSGREQATVFELGRDAAGSTLASLEGKAGKPIQYQTREARRAGSR